MTTWLLERTLSTSFSVQVDQTTARLVLKEKHVGELAEAMRNYSPQQALIKQYEQEHKEAQEACRKYEQEVGKSSREELNRKKEEKRDEEEEKRRKMEEELR